MAGRDRPVPRVLRRLHEQVLRRRGAAARIIARGPVTYVGHDLLQIDIDNLKAAVDAVTADGYEVADVFMPSSGPSGFGKNEYYDSDAEYLNAVAEAMREEYKAIVDAGFILQVDDPWLIEYLTDPARPWEARVEGCNEHVDAVNHALRGIPIDKVRHHTCYGLNHGPRLTDVPLAKVVPFMLRVNAGAYSFEVANPRHQHEYRVWEDHDAPRRQGVDPRSDRTRQQLRRARGVDRRVHRAVRRPGRQGARDRRRRLRVLVTRQLQARGAPHSRVAQVQAPRNGRRAGIEAVLGPLSSASRPQSVRPSSQTLPLVPSTVTV